MPPEPPEPPERPGPPDQRGPSPRSEPTIGRRALIASAIGVAVVGTLAAVAIPRYGATEPSAASPTPSPTPTTPPAPTRTIDAVRADAFSTAGMRYGSSPWAVPAAAAPATWSLLYVNWLLRENGMPEASAPLDLYSRYEEQGLVGTEARDGALIFYSNGPSSTIYHVGFVEHAGAGLVSTVEGDVPGDLPTDQTFVRRYGRPWDGNVVYAYPAYAAA